jgi:hypothetical protein
MKPIELDRRDGGAMTWFDHLDAKFRVPIEFMGPAYPKTAKQLEAWLIKQLREDTSQGFFFRTLAHPGMALDFKLLQCQPTGNPAFFITTGTVPLAQLFLLPNVDPEQELREMKDMLAWLDGQLAGQGPKGRDGTVQWFRGGYRNRGLEAASFQDEEKREALNLALANWR